MHVARLEADVPEQELAPITVGHVHGLVLQVNDPVTIPNEQLNDADPLTL